MIVVIKKAITENETEKKQLAFYRMHHTNSHILTNSRSLQLFLRNILLIVPSSSFSSSISDGVGDGAHDSVASGGATALISDFDWLTEASALEGERSEAKTG